jgi:2-isopropylmalate synthase
MELIRYWPNPLQEDPMQIAGRVEVKLDGDPHTVEATAGGPISAFVRAIRKLNVPDFRLEEYEEDALSSSADAEAVTFVRIEGADSGESFFGVGFGINIDQAAVQAIVSALNQLMLKERASEH